MPTILAVVSALAVALSVLGRFALARLDRRLEATAAAVAEQTRGLSQQAARWAEERDQTAAAERGRLVSQAVDPLRNKLGEVERRLEDLRVEREQARLSFGQQMATLREQHHEVTRETRRLNEALARPTVRGQWGEMRLRSVIEAAGLVEHTQFVLQAAHPTDDGVIRPDAVVRLPGGRVLAIDAKVPLPELNAGANAGASGDSTALAVLLRGHAKALGAKRYWQGVDDSLELVVLFLPSEALLSRALEADPKLFHDAMQSRVLLASPTSLMAVLMSVAYGWRQEAVAASAAELARLGQELTDRARVVSEHMQRLGQRLNGAVDAYHKTASSLESRVLVTARRIAASDPGQGDADRSSIARAA